jgi:hypothetical protein
MHADRAVALRVPDLAKLDEATDETLEWRNWYRSLIARNAERMIA